MAVIYATSLFMRSKGIPIRAISIQNILVNHKFVFANPISHILYITITSRPLTISTTFINIHKMRYPEFHDNNAKQQRVFAHIFYFNFSWIWLVSFNFLLQNGFVDCPIYNWEHSTLIRISNEEKIMPIHLHANVLKPKRGKAFKSQFTFIFIFF